MRTSIIRAVAASLVVGALLAPSAQADSFYPAPGVANFNSGVGRWTGVEAECNLLVVLPCLGTITNDPDGRGNAGGAIATNYTPVLNAGLVNPLVLQTARGTWRSPTFTVTGAPTSAILGFDRSAELKAFLDFGGSVRVTSRLVRVGSPNVITTLPTESLQPPNSPPLLGGGGRVPYQRTLRMLPAPLVGGADYFIELTAEFSSNIQAPLGTLSAIYDNVQLRVVDGTDDGNVGPVAFTLDPELDPAPRFDPRVATFKASINPKASPTTYSFRYRKAGESDAQARTTPDRTFGDLTSKDFVTVAETVGDLEACNQYVVRAVASNAQAVAEVNEVRFSTYCSPTVATLPAAPVSFRNAGLNASIRPNGPEATYFYEFAANPDFVDSARLPARSAGTGFESKQPLTETVGNLVPGTRYFFRARASNGLGGEVIGATGDFTTPLEPQNGAPGATGVPGNPGAPGIGVPGRPGARGPTGSTGSNQTLNNGDERALLRIRTARVLVGSKGRRRGQIRLNITCSQRTGQNCAGTVKLRTRGKINPSSIPGRRRASRKVTFATFEYQLAQGKVGVAIATIQPEKLDLLRRIKRTSIDILVQVSDANNNRQTIRRAGSIVLG